MAASVYLVSAALFASLVLSRGMPKSETTRNRMPLDQLENLYDLDNQSQEDVLFQRLKQERNGAEDVASQGGGAGSAIMAVVIVIIIALLGGLVYVLYRKCKTSDVTVTIEDEEIQKDFAE